jgi:CPA2 family monovalent cation:H+ antiporter-2
MHIPLLTDIIIILALSVAVAFVFRQFKIPTILGFLITGILAGPNLFSLVKGVHEVEILAEIGVILLLFTVGLEFSLEELNSIKKSVFIGGSIQVMLTIAIVAFVAMQFSLGPGQSIFIGFLISLSSTAIVLKLLQERGEIDSPHGKTVLGILIFQDIAVVPMMLFTPLLSGKSGDIWSELALLALKGFLVLAGIFISIKFIMPKLLYQIARTNSGEIFLLGIVAICFSVAWITSSIGLSLALGAFVAGIIISESEYSHQAESYVLPFRAIFESFFFVSIGMLFDVRFLMDNLLIIVLITAGVLIIKTIISGIAVFSLRLPFRTIILAGLALCQVGEFSFILSKIGINEGIIDSNIYQYFLSVSIMTMGVTPIIMKYSHNFTYAFLKAPIPTRLHKLLNPELKTAIKEKRTYKNHLVIIGYGLNGRVLAKAARYAVIPYVVIDINADRVKRELEKNENIFYGDAAYDNTLKKVCVENARVVVIGISDPVSTRRVVSNVRNLNSTVYVIVRTRYMHEIDELKKLGANEVIAEEFEAAIEIFTRVLSKYLLPQDDIGRFVEVIRSDGYEMLRPYSAKSDVVGDLNLNLSDVDISAIKLRPNCTIINQTLAESDIRNKFGITLLALKRGSEIINTPDAETKLHEKDVLYVFGEPENISRFNKYINKK